MSAPAPKSAGRKAGWIAGCLLVCMSVAAADRPPIDWTALTAEDAVPGQLLVGYKPGISLQAVADVHAQVGAQVVHQYRLIPTQVVTLPDGMSMHEAVRIYKASPAIDYVEPNYIVHALSPDPNDPEYLAGNLWGMERIRAPEAWDITTGSRDVVVAVIDTGINYNHLDLIENMWVNPNPIPGVNDIHGARWTGGQGLLTSGDPMDDHNHGTHCAGTIGAVGNNSIGVVGVVWEVQLVALKFLTASGGGATADAISAIEYCVERADQIKIISNSWGGGGFSQALLNMIVASRDAGQLFVAAAGNSAADADENPMYPAAYDVDNIISVAAINEAGDLAGFSNYGRESVHIGAPGVGILSTVALGEPENNHYESYRGTSMACPHVAGAAALLWSLAPGATWQMIKQAILDGAAPNAELAGRTITGGELDLMGAIENMGGQIDFDRKAYQSDADVRVTVQDFSVSVAVNQVPVELYMRVGGGPARRWTDFLNLPRIPTEIASFETSVTLESQVAFTPHSAVHGDLLRAEYIDGYGRVLAVQARIDDVKPVLSDLMIRDITEDTATVIWRTDEPADSRVWMGDELPLDPASEQGTTDYVEEQTLRNGLMGYWHEVTIEGLSEETRYYVAVLSSDYAGNEGSLPDDLASVDPDDYGQLITRKRRAIYVEDWEHGPQGWTVTNLKGELCWELGTPRFGPLTAFSGTNCWGTILDGRYPPFANASLTSPYFELAERPQLSIRHWYDIEDFYDYGYLEANRGAGWELLAVFMGESGGWIHDVVELPLRFNHKNVRFRFRLESDYTVEYAGWYVDDLEISVLSPVGVYISFHEVKDDPPGGDGDGFAEPGETFVLTLHAFNNQMVTAPNVTAKVETFTPGVTIAGGPIRTIAFGDMASGSQADSGNQLSVTVADHVPVGTRITFLVTLKADGMGPWYERVILPVVERDSITGTITDADDGTPVEAATVEGMADGYPAVSAPTGADGTYALHGLWPGVAYEIEAVKPGDYSRNSYDAGPVIGPQADVDIALGKAYADPDPDVLVFALDQGQTDTRTVTLQNFNAPYTTEYVFEAAIRYDTVATDWLTISPVSDAVPADGTLDIDVTADAGALDPTLVHEATLILTGNDISDEPVEIPITLTISAAPWLDFYDWRALGGDDDPYVEPGETIDLALSLVNYGSVDAVGVDGTLTYVGVENVVVSQPNAEWPSVWAPIMGWTFPTESTTHPTIMVGANVPDGAVLPFTLEVTDADLREWSFDFAVTVTVRRTIMGEVTVCGGGPVAGAEVRVRDQVDGTLFVATTDVNGEYRVDGLDGFDYIVRVVPPVPYASPEAVTVTFPPGNGTEVVNFCVEDWGISVDPTEITVTIPEGTSTTVPLTVFNSGSTVGSVEFDVQLVSGIVEPAPMGVLTPPPVPWDSLEPGDHAPHELMIRFEDSAGPSVQQDILMRYGLQMLRTFQYVPAMRVRIPQNVRLQEMAETLAADPAIRYVEPNYRLEFHRMPNDPYFDELWALNNMRQTGGTRGADINVLPAWERVTGSPDVVVAIVDSGTDYRHDDLVDNMVPGYDYGEDDPDPIPAYEANNLFDVIHGTHVAGTVGAVGNNLTGVVGVMWEVSLMPLKMGKISVIPTPIGDLEMLVADMDAAIASVEHCVTHDVHISNHSYGFRFFSGIFYEALYAAYENGHLVIVSAGNDFRNDNDKHPRYPMNYDLPNIIGVAATNPDGELADFSNIGARSVDIAAPGVDILSTVSLELDPFLFHLYLELSGTSMSAPLVSGAAALLKAAAPEATWDMIKRALLDGARRDDGLLGMVATGHLDVMRALDILSAPWIAVAPTILNVPAGGNADAAVTLNVDETLLAGTYEATILVRQGLNMIEVPVTLNVTPAPSPKWAGTEIIDPPPGGDGDGYAEPGETVDLAVHLRNAGSAFLIDPVGTLDTSLPGVNIEIDQASWPSMPSGRVEPSLTHFRVTFDAAVSGPVPFDLLVADASGREWNLSFHVDVEERLSLRGVLTDALTADPLAGVRIEYWGAAVGAVTSGVDGVYGIHGLSAGDYRFRPLAETHEIPEPEAVSLVAQDEARDFALRATAPSLPGNIQVTAPLRQWIDQDWILSNTAPVEFDFTIREMPRRKVALISDGGQLNDVAPVLRDLGFDVTVYSNNYYYFQGAGGGEARGWYSGDAAVLAAHDLVIADLSGPRSGGRLLSFEEQTAIEDFLSRNRHFWITGAHPISRPDDRRIQGLVGADSLDRTQAGKDITVEYAPAGTDFLHFEGGEVIQRAATALDEATPAPGQDINILLGAEDAVKVMRRRPVKGGQVVYWGGNRNGTDWARPGTLQDYFRTLLAEEFWSDVPWLTVGQPTGSISDGALTISLLIDTHALEAGDYHGRLVVLGNYPGAPVRSASIHLTAEQPTFRVKASSGVVDWLGRRLPGNGGSHSAIFQVIYAGNDGIPNEPGADGKPGGDDLLLALLPSEHLVGRIGVGYETTPDMGRLSQWVKIPDGLPSGAPIYVRAWDAAAFGDAVAYGDSAVHTLPAMAHGSLIDFGGWVVDQAPGYPGPHAKDTNGDGVLDGWYIKFGRDPRVPVGPLVATGTASGAWGVSGSAAGQFNRPHKAFVAGQLLFVLDRQNHRIAVWNRDAMTPVSTYGGQGTINGTFNQPAGMGRHPTQNRFAVADTENNRIQVFSFDETTGAITFEQVFGSPGTGDGQFSKPRGVAIDVLGRFIVADTGNNRIQIFNANGVFQQRFGSLGSGTGPFFNQPADVAADGDGLIYVADTGNHRIQGFSGGGSWLWALGSQGAAAGRFEQPNGIEVGIMGRIFVADTSNHRIQIFDAQRTHLLSVGSFGVGTGQLRFPYGVAPIPDSGAFYAVDTWNHRIQRFDTIIDSNGNGIDDVWAFLNFGEIDIDPLADPDEDGLSNLAEFRLRTDPNKWDTSGNGWSDGDEVRGGSDPNNPDDIPFLPLAIRAAPSMRPELIIEWPMYSGRTYWIEYTTDLLADEPWTPLPGSLFTAPANGYYRITNEPPDTVEQSIFYRLMEMSDY